MLARWLLLLPVVFAFSPIWSQTKPPSSATTDYAQEAAVLEEMVTKLAFQNSGDHAREQTSRVRIQSDAGVKNWGLLTFPYQSATQIVEVDYVRVRKPDGTTIVTPADNIQDLDSDITRAAPFYSDLREKHVAVKGLGKGDTLEYAAHWRTTKPIAPGQFWFEYSFHPEGIVLSEKLEIRVPAERAIKVKGPDTQTVSNQGSERVYTGRTQGCRTRTTPPKIKRRRLKPRADGFLRRTSRSAPFKPGPKLDAGTGTCKRTGLNLQRRYAPKLRNSRKDSAMITPSYGSEKMKAQANQLKAIAFDVPAPTGAQTHFVWRGILGCYQYSGCSLVVLDPISVRSVN